jgi:hypothetical protein
MAAIPEWRPVGGACIWLGVWDLSTVSGDTTCGRALYCGVLQLDAIDP